MGNESRQIRTGPYVRPPFRSKSQAGKSRGSAEAGRQEGPSLQQGGKGVTLPVQVRTLGHVCVRSGVAECTCVQGHPGRPRVGRDAGGLEDGPVGHMEVRGKQRRRPHEQKVGLTDSPTLAYMPKTEQLLT